MTTDELYERAQRHGLYRSARAWRILGEGEPPALVWSMADGSWAWGPPTAGTLNAPRYPSEAKALGAALDWLDTQYPQNAWRSSPGEVLRDAIELLRAARKRCTENTDSCASSDVEDAISESIALLQRLGGSMENLSPDALLGVALDLAQEQAQVSEPLRRAITRTVRACPDMVNDLRLLSPWELTQSRGSERVWWERRWIGAAPGAGYAVATVELINGRWWWFVYPPRDKGISISSGEVESPVDGRRAADAYLVSETALQPHPWVLCSTPEFETPPPVAPELQPDTPAPEPEEVPVEAPRERRICEDCDGLGERVDPFSRYGIASRCRSCAGTGYLP